MALMRAPLGVIKAYEGDAPQLAQDNDDYDHNESYSPLIFNKLETIKPDSCHEEVKAKIFYVEARDLFYPIQQVATLIKKLAGLEDADSIRFVLRVNFGLFVGKDGNPYFDTPGHCQGTGGNYFCLNAGAFGLKNHPSRAIIRRITNQTGAFRSHFDNLQLTVMVLVQTYVSQDNREKNYLDFTPIVILKDFRKRKLAYSVTKEHLINLGRNLWQIYEVLLSKDNLLKIANIFHPVTYKEVYQLSHSQNANASSNHSPTTKLFTNNHSHRKTMTISPNQLNRSHTSTLPTSHKKMKCAAENNSIDTNSPNQFKGHPTPHKNKKKFIVTESPIQNFNFAALNSPSTNTPNPYRGHATPRKNIKNNAMTDSPIRGFNLAAYKSPSSPMHKQFLAMNTPEKISTKEIYCELASLNDGTNNNMSPMKIINIQFSNNTFPSLDDIDQSKRSQLSPEAKKAGKKHAHDVMRANVQKNKNILQFFNQMIPPNNTAKHTVSNTTDLTTDFLQP